MKKVYASSICMVILIFIFSMSYAQMGGGKSGGMMGGQQGGMMESREHMEGMMQGHEVSGGLMHNMGQMSRLMQQMRDMMANKSDAASMHKMSRLMREISEHAEKMAAIMDKGGATKDEMQELDEHNRMMQERYEKMRW